MAPSQFTELRPKLLSPICFSAGNLKLHSLNRLAAMNRTVTEAISTNAIMLIFISH